MKCWTYIVTTLLAIALFAGNSHAQDEHVAVVIEEQPVDATLEIHREEAIDVDVDVDVATDDVLRLEAAVKKVEDELRDNQQFIIKAQKASDKIVLDLDDAISNLQLEARDANAQLRDANDRANWRARAQREREKGAFLGVSGSSVTSPLREQLKLPRGIGLVVEHVQPKSPAEQAGLKRFDVLHKLNDQLLINSHQLAVLVRTHKPGDEVKLSVIRGGETKEFTTKLSEAELEPLDENNPWGALPLWREELKKAIEPENQVRVLTRPRTGTGILTRVVEKDGSAKIVSVDDEHTLILAKTDDDGAHELRVLNRDGREIFRGPLDKDEDLQNLPKDIGKKALPLWGSLKQGGGRGGTERIVEKAEVRQAESKDQERRVVEVSEGGITMKVTVERDGDVVTTHLSARDKAGNQLFDGPIDTDEQRKALPRDVAERLNSPDWKAMLDQRRQPVRKP